jgi:hypothetical protein
MISPTMRQQRLDDARVDSRFAELLKKLGLPQ